MLATPFPFGPLLIVVIDEDACLRICILLSLHLPPDEVDRESITVIFIEVYRLGILITVRGRGPTVSENAGDCRFKEHY